ncbi:C1 family peptidase [Clostridium cibarium]|uniref:Peptidase C1A papain C-terminal domain-containing protein n=1 Tax=Clostridium cibarium TaxID=2762247 RepID=A0ABR8PR24_9CLOT|nr:C1 family peptidase [Clostridium cibarium]MBD7910618.1 hypothetical protein [Clostridium cibarium]
MKKRLLSTLLALTMTSSFFGTSSQVKAAESEKTNSSIIENSTEDNASYKLSEDGHRFGIAKESALAKNEQSNNFIKKVSSVGLNPLGKARINGESPKELPADSVTEDGYFKEDQPVEGINEKLPSNVDNSALDAFPGISNQGSLGACASFSSTYYEMSHMVNLMDRRNGNSDEHRFSPRWTYNLLNDGADAGTKLEDNYQLIKNIGVATLADAPYIPKGKPETNFRAWESNALTWKRAERYSIKEVREADFPEHISNSKDACLNEIKTALANGYAINYYTTWDSCVWDKGEFGIKDDPSTKADDNYVGQKVCIYNNNKGDDFVSNHGLTIVGYNDDIWTDIDGDGIVDDGEKGAFKVANSWGENWGNKGFFWVCYDAFNSKSQLPNMSSEDRGVHGNYFMWVIPSILPESKLYAKFTLNTSNRMACSVNLVATDKKTREKTRYNFYPLRGSVGGQYSFMGTTEASDGTFAIDLSRVIKDITSEKLSSYKWTLEFSDGPNDNKPLQLKEFKIVDEVKNDEYSTNAKMPISVDGTAGNATVFEDYPDLVVNRIDTDKPEPRVVGTKVKITPNVSGGSGDMLYTYSIVSQYTGKAIEVISKDTTDSSIIWTPKEEEVGSCNIKVEVTDKKTGEKTSSARYYSVNRPLEMKDVYIYDDTVHSVGKEVVFRAMETGGNGEVTFTCKVTSPENYVVAENSINNSIVWIPRKPGQYTIEVIARDDTGVFVTKELAYTVTEPVGEVSKPSNLKLSQVDNKHVKLSWSSSTTSNGTIGGYRIYRDGVLEHTTNNEEYTIQLDNKYHKYSVMAYSSDSIYSVMSDEINTGCEVLNFKGVGIDKPSPRLIENPITISTHIEGGSGSRLYTYSLINSSGVVKEIIAENTSEDSKIWTPKEAGEFKVRVNVKDTVTGETGIKELECSINKPLNIEKFENVDSNNKPVGSKIVFNTVATGGDGKITYTYKVVSPEKTTILENSDKTSIEWIPRKSGIYWIEVQAKDSLGNVKRVIRKYTVADPIGSVSKPILKLTMANLNQNKIKILWDPSTTTIGNIAGYDIYCDGEKINTIKENSFTFIYDSNHVHKYSVMAFNSEGIYSEMSSSM